MERDDCGVIVVMPDGTRTDEVIWQTRSIGVLYEPHNRKDELAQTVREVLVSLDRILLKK